MSALLDTPSAAPPRRPRPATRELSVAPYDVAAARRLGRELGVSHVLAQVLVRRGLSDAAAARAWLAAGERHDPAAFAGMDEAVERVLHHVRARTRITVHGDYDVDGVCATVVLVRALRALGAHVDWFIPGRMEDGYGLSEGTVQRLAARGTRLLVTADCGVASVEEVAAARAAGLDVVVTDHHSPRADGTLPDAPIVHPAVGGYPCPHLCAAGVAHKVVEALARAAGADPSLATRDLDLVALATVADVVPLVGENRRLVREGLRAMGMTRTPGLRALMRVARVDPGELDASALGFRLGPRINAAGRLHRADAGVELLLCDDEDRAAEIAAELDAANAERRAVEQSILWSAEEQLAELGERAAYVLASPDWHRGVVGIVASRLVERYHRPAILIALDGETGTGSGRSISGFDLLGGLHACAEHLERYGGHRVAAGVTIAADRVDAFREAFEAHAEDALSAADLVPYERVDAVVAGAELGLPLAEELAALEPCGAGNPPVTLLVPAARCVDPRPMGENGRHLRFTVESGGVRARAVAFGCDGRLGVAEAEPCDLTFRLERREWNGAVEARLLLRDARPCAPGPIEVLGEPGPGDWLSAALAEAALEPHARAADDPPVGIPIEAALGTGRAVVDRRRLGPAGVLGDLVRSGDAVLAVVADVPRRLAALRRRVGGFALVSWDALARDPSLAEGFRHVALIDPPASPPPALPGPGFTHMAWGDQELAFARGIHDAAHDLRPGLAALYRALRGRGVVAGAELERALRGEPAGARSPRVAGRMLRVLGELGLVEVDARAAAARVVSDHRTELERSPTWRSLARALEEGRRFLTGATSVPVG